MNTAEHTDSPLHLGSNKTLRQRSPAEKKRYYSPTVNKLPISWSLDEWEVSHLWTRVSYHTERLK